MRMILLLATSLFFNGCQEPKPCEPKKIFVKAKVPKLTILYKVPVYEIKDIKSIDSNYYAVNKKELHKASEASQKRIHNINFYEKQNRQFNREFAK